LREYLSSIHYNHGFLIFLQTFSFLREMIYDVKRYRLWSNL